MILIEKQLKYQHYHQAKLINTNIIRVKRNLVSDQSKMIELAKFTYSI